MAPTVQRVSTRPLMPWQWDSNNQVYAGGDFISPAMYIARWNGTKWSALGSGLNKAVNALMISGNRLYAGGYFTAAGGNPAKNIAAWNGTGWSALGSGVDKSVEALANTSDGFLRGRIFQHRRREGFGGYRPVQHRREERTALSAAGGKIKQND